MYHPGVWLNGNFSCCDQREKQAPGCRPTFAEKQAQQGISANGIAGATSPGGNLHSFLKTFFSSQFYFVSILHFNELMYPTLTLQVQNHQSYQKPSYLPYQIRLHQLCRRHIQSSPYIVFREQKKEIFL